MHHNFICWFSRLWPHQRSFLFVARSVILWCSLTSCLQFEAIIITCGAVEVLFRWGQTGAYETAINVLPAQLVLCWKNQVCMSVILSSNCGTIWMSWWCVWGLWCICNILVSKVMWRNAHVIRTGFLFLFFLLLWLMLYQNKTKHSPFFSTQLGLIFNPHRDQCMNFHTERKTQALVCLEIKITPVHLKTCIAACLTSQSEERNDSNRTSMDWIYNWHFKLFWSWTVHLKDFTIWDGCFFFKLDANICTHNSVLHNHYSLKAFIHKHKETDKHLLIGWFPMEIHFSLITFLYMLFFCRLFWVAC